MVATGITIYIIMINNIDNISDNTNDDKIDNKRDDDD